MELARMRWARFSSRGPVGSAMMPRTTSVVGEDEMDSHRPPQVLSQPELPPPLAYGEYRRPTGVRTRRSPRVEAAPPAVEEEKVASEPQTESVESTPDTEPVASTPNTATIESTQAVASTSESETVTSAPTSEPVAATPEVETTLPQVDDAAMLASPPISKAAPPKPRSSAAAPPRPRRSPHIDAAKAQEKSVLTMIRKKEARGMDTRNAKPQTAKAPKKATPDVLVKARQEQKQSQQKQKQRQPQKQQAGAQDQTLVTKLKSSLFGNWFSK